VLIPDNLSYGVTPLVRDCCLGLHVVRAARAVARRFDEALRPAGLTNQQFSLLMSLNRPVPPNMSSVAELLAMDRTTLTAALKPLERRKLVKVVVDENDKRGRRLVLSAGGKAALAEALPLWKRAQAQIERQITDISPDSFRTALRAIS
jgi:DNA-binding MarR family transcriptional regulator